VLRHNYSIFAKTRHSKNAGRTATSRSASFRATVHSTFAMTTEPGQYNQRLEFTDEIDDFILLLAGDFCEHRER
jgi:hypothetical protein